MVYTQDEPSFGFQYNTCQNIQLNGVVLQTEFLSCDSIIFVSHIALVIKAVPYVLVSIQHNFMQNYV
jgi:hypothetical protein